MDSMSSYWNHRVIRTRHAKTETVAYYIHEVYYQEDGSIAGWTERPVTPVGETVQELRKEIERFLLACYRPILEEKETDEGSDLFPGDT